MLLNPLVCNIFVPVVSGACLALNLQWQIALLLISTEATSLLEKLTDDRNAGVSI